MLRVAALAGFLALAASAQTVDLTGTILNERNQPVKGAVVRLKAFPYPFDTTDISGAYQLAGEASGVKQHAVPGSLTKQWELRGNAVMLTVDGREKVSVDLYTLTGRRSVTLINQELPSGTHRITLPATRGQASVLRIRTGDRVGSLKINPLAYQMSTESTMPRMAPMSKAAATPDSLMVAHPYFDTAYTALSAYTGAVNDTISYRHLNDSEYIRVLVPNGGEVYSYGDLVTIAWLQKITVSPEAVVSIGRNTLGYSCDIPFDQTQWNRYPRDYQTPTAQKSYILTDSAAGEAIGLYTLTAKDTSVMLCASVKFAGDTNWVEIWDPYPEPYSRAQLSDQSDSYYTVLGHP